MTLCVYGIVFPFFVFFENCKSVKKTKSTTPNVVLSFQNGAFRIDFRIDLRGFSKHPPRDHFWKVQAPIYAQKCDVRSLLNPRGVPKSHLGATFSAKRSTVRYPAKPTERPGADLDANWRRQRPKTFRDYICLQIFARFCTNF